MEKAIQMEKYGKKIKFKMQDISHSCGKSKIGGKSMEKNKMQDIGHSYGKNNIGGKVWKKN